MLTAVINTKIEPQLKKEVESILTKYGVNTTQAITMFFKQIALNKAFPSDMKIPNAETIQAIRDAENGIGLEEITFEQHMEEMKKCIIN